MLVAVAVCPNPPLLVPDVAPGTSDELAALRAAAVDAVLSLGDADPTIVVAVGAAEESGWWGDSAAGSMRRFGVDATFGGTQPVLPASLTVAAYLLDRAAWTGPRHYAAVPRDLDAADAADLGRHLAADDGRVALLVMGDGSAKRSTEAPGYLDERAAEYDAALVAALAGPDPQALLRLDADLARELWVDGRAAWQVLAGAAETVDARAVSTKVRYDDAPYGVGYFVVDWRLAG